MPQPVISSIPSLLSCRSKLATPLEQVQVANRIGALLSGMNMTLKMLPNMTAEEW